MPPQDEVNDHTVTENVLLQAAIELNKEDMVRASQPE